MAKQHDVNGPAGSRTSTKDQAKKAAAEFIDQGRPFTAIPTMDGGYEFGTPESVKVQRWPMSAHELDHPRQCDEEDVLIAYTDEFSKGVAIQRNGVILDRDHDGQPIEVSDKQRTQIRKLRKLDHPRDAVDGTDETAQWRNVLVSPEGRFMDFAGE